MRTRIASTLLASYSFCGALALFAQSPSTDPKLAALNQRLRAEIHKTAPPLDLPAANALLNRLSTTLDPTLPPVTFEIVRSQRTSIFVLPGGPALVPSGLLRQVSTPQQLLAHLAHAIGHIRLGHGTRARPASPAANLQEIPLIYVGGWEGIHPNPAQPSLLPSGFRALQQRWEREADEFAARLLRERSIPFHPDELRQLQSSLPAQTFSSNPPSLLR